MNPTRLLALCSSALLALSTLLPAQVVHMRGEVVDGRATGCYYCPGYQYVIKWIGTRLDGSLVSLAPYLDKQVDLTGTWNGSVVTPIITVTSIQLATESFSISGTTRLGDRLRFNAIAPQGTMAANVLGFARAFVPMLPLVFNLDPTTAIVLGSGPTNGAGEFKSDLSIPNDPALVGLRFYGEALIVPPASIPYWSNPDSKVVTL